MPDEKTPSPDATTGESTKPAEPTDDLVTTKHQLKVGPHDPRLHGDHRPRGAARGGLRGRHVHRLPRQGRGLDDVVRARRRRRSGDRPVTFAFNGGPGSSSVWLHLGLLGPRRVLMGDAGALLPPPYALADNPSRCSRSATWCSSTRCRPATPARVEGSKPEPFHGYQGDIESVGRADPDLDVAPQALDVAEVRRRRVLRHAARRRARRAPAVAARHVRQRADPDLQRPRPRLHRLREPAQRPRARALPADVRRDRAATTASSAARRSARRVADAEEYAARDYPWVLSRGDRLTAKERAAAVTQARLADRALARTTSTAPTCASSTGGSSASCCATSAVRSAGSTAASPARWPRRSPSTWTPTRRWTRSAGPTPRPSTTTCATSSATRATCPTSRSPRRVHPWSFKDFEGRPIDVTPKLERAMRANPHLQVHVAYGYFDGATPHFAAEDVIAHLQIPDELRANIEHRYYEAGHMMYVHEPTPAPAEQGHRRLRRAFLPLTFVPSRRGARTRAGCRSRPGWEHDHHRTALDGCSHLRSRQGLRSGEARGLRR